MDTDTQVVNDEAAAAVNDESPGATVEHEEEELDLERAKAKISKVNQEAATLRRRAKEAEAKVREFEERDKTDSEKLTEQSERDRIAADAATREAARLRVALRKGLTETQSRRLIGDTEEELESDADALVADFAPTDQESDDTKRRPRERLRPGATPSGEPDETDPDKLAAMVPRLYR